MPFRKVSERFRLIDQNTHTVYVPVDEGAELVRQLRDGYGSKALFRKLGRYAVNVFDEHYRALYDAGALLTARDIPALDAGSAVLCDLRRYDAATGLSMDSETGMANFI